MDYFWEQPGRLEQLEKLVTQGLSARAIALRMKTTRNAVISAVHRKLPHCRFGGSPGRRKVQLSPAGQTPPRAKARKEKERRARAPKAVKAELRKARQLLRQENAFRHSAPLAGFSHGFAGQGGRVSLAALAAAHCRFPIDMPDGEVRYCGLERNRGSSYCAHHRVRCAAERG